MEEEDDDDQECILVSIESTGYYFLMVMKCEISGHIFDMYTCTKFHQNTSSENQVVICGQTYIQADRRAQKKLSFPQ